MHRVLVSQRQSAGRPARPVRRRGQVGRGRALVHLAVSAARVARVLHVAAPTAVATRQITGRRRLTAVPAVSRDRAAATTATAAAADAATASAAAGDPVTAYYLQLVRHEFGRAVTCLESHHARCDHDES